MGKNRFFVYGTLKVGGRFAGYLDNIRTSSRQAILQNHDLFSIGQSGYAAYPGAVPGTGDIIGELHEYGGADLKSVLKILDDIEGYYEYDEKNSLYIRTRKDIFLKTGEEVEAFVYIFNQPIKISYNKIESGVWEI